MREVELLPTRDCEAGYGPAGKRAIYVLNRVLDAVMKSIIVTATFCMKPESQTERKLWE